MSVLSTGQAANYLPLSVVHSLSCCACLSDLRNRLITLHYWLTDWLLQHWGLWLGLGFVRVWPIVLVCCWWA